MQQLTPTARQFILEVMAATHDLTLATLRPDGYPQATVVSYVHDDLVIYAGIGLDSQKARNVQQDPRVSLTITPSYADWDHIRGVSMAATATIVGDPGQTARAADLMQFRFPQLRKLMQGKTDWPWPGAVFLRIVPNVISLLDYRQGFGHTEQYQVD